MLTIEETLNSTLSYCDRSFLFDLHKFYVEKNNPTDIANFVLETLAPETANQDLEVGVKVRSEFDRFSALYSTDRFAKLGLRFSAKCARELQG